MPKLNSLTELFSLLNTSGAPPSPHHFLILLGTDTVFTAKPTIPEKDYERGETLSHTAQAVATILGESAVAEIRPKGEPLSFCSPSVDVLNGPTTLGPEVGDRIAQAIFLALRAAASGKKTLQIPAHSRGAVEATLLIHELSRIKLALAKTPLKPLKTILLESPDKLTVDAVGRLFQNAVEGESAESRALLLQRLNELEINPFLIDPVPGDTIYALPGIAWHDDRFYHEVPCNHYELLFCRDERTACFYPILPKGMEPTIIPGHHGTASGNRYTQQLARLPPSLEGKDTTGVQDLVLLKLLHFLQLRTKLLDQPRLTIDTGNPALDKLTSEFVNGNDDDREKQLLEQYNRVKENDDAYRYFRTTAYSYLGRAVTTDGHRYFHDKGAAYKSMSTIAPEMRGPIVNAEHAKLYLAYHFPIFKAAQDKSPVLQVAAISGVLKEMVGRAKDLEDASSMISMIQQEDTEGDSFFFNGLSTLVDSISQKYLHNDISSDEKISLLDIMKVPFTVLATAIADDHLLKKDFFIRCQNVLQDGVNITINTHCNAIVQQYEQLHQQIQLVIAPPEHFTATFTNLLDTLTIDDALDSLKSIKARLSAIDPITIDNIRDALSIELEAIQREEPGAQKEFLTKTLLNDQFLRLQDYFEADQRTIEQYLTQMEQLHNAAIELYRTYPQLKSLVGEKPLDFAPHQLFLYSSGLVGLAGTLLKEKRIDLRHLPTTLSEPFYTLVKNQAITFGAPSPEVEDLKQQASTLTDATEAMQLEILALAAKDTAQDEAIVALKAEHELALADKDTVKDEAIAALKAEHELVLATKNTAQDEAVAVLKTANDLALKKLGKKKDDEVSHQQETIDRLEHQVKKHADAQTATVNHFLALTAEKDTTIDGLNDQRKQLTSKEETTNGFLIHHKLIPLTTDYLSHILDQAHKYFPNIDRKDHGQKLPASHTLKHPERDAYNQIKTKFEITQNLHEQLTAKDVVLPSQRLKNFTNALNDSQSNLKLHRNPAWRAYFTSCLAVIAIIATGVIPGILGLGAYKLATGKSPLFFSQSKGGRFVDEVTQEISPNPGKS